MTLVSDDYFIAQLLAELRWQRGFRCRKCGGHRAVQLKCRPRVFECCACHCQNSVTAGTALHRARLPLGHIVLAAVLQARPQSVSANELSRIIGCRYETAWKLLHRVRHALLQPAQGAAAESASTCPVKTRPQPRELPHRAGRVVQVLAVRGADRRVLTAVSDHDQEVPLHALVDQLPQARPLASLEQAAPWLRPLPVLLRQTYRSVSLRWLRRYAGAWAWSQGRAHPHQGLLRQLLRAPAVPWRTLRIAPLLPSLHR